MKYKYKIVVIIAFLLLTLSMGVSFINYTISMNSTQNQLKTQSLPLSVDNIYTEIQKHMIEPFLVSSMMAQDTFVKDWILKEENNTEKIQKYLDSIKNKYGLLSAFLVSHKTKNYYTQDGFLETVHESNPRNQWYFRFKDIAQDNEINLDFNEHLSNTLMMFINFKMFDKNYNYLGATGIAMKISYIDNMLKSFKENYKLTVSFLDKDGNVVLSREHNQKELVNIDSIDELA
ncbi:MAG: cache domain-containing protein, partial [Sulfurimonas sp.]|nr:cache domain-containing protein [Sulfurimonas sp.]